MIDKAGLIPGIGQGIGGAGKVGSAASAGASGGAGFADLVKEAAGDALKAGQGSEVQALKAAAKDAEIVDVVTAVANAEITLETVMTVRDRVISAYQEIMKMPI
jgi:flagellar hook-basal body complex protein FliE